MKDDTSTPTTDGNSPNEFERNKPGTNARSDAEAAIEEVRARGGVFVNAVRATRMPMVLTDPNLPGNPIVFANHSFLKLSGYDMDEVLGQKPHFMNGPETDAQDAARFTEALRADQDDIIETVQYRKNGGRFVATVLISAFKDAHGHTLNHFMSWLDVTRRVEAESEVSELRAAQSALCKSEAKYRTLFDSIDEGFCVVEVLFDADGKAGDYLFLEVNGAFERQTGLSNAVGKRMRELRPNHEQSWFDIYGQVALTGKPKRFEQAAEALGHWYDVYAFRIGEPEERRVAILFNSIAERKRAEALVRASEERLRNVLDSMAEGFALFDRDFTIVDVNDETLRLDGRSRSDLVGRSHWEAFPETEHSSLGEMFKRVMRTGEPGLLEHVYRWPDGKEMWIETRAYPTSDSGVACFWRDVTDRKRTEDALRESEERHRENQARQAFLLLLSDRLRPLQDAIEIQNTAMRQLAEQLGVARAGYYEVAADQDSFCLKARWERGTLPLPEKLKMSDFGPDVREGYRAGRTLVSRDIERDSPSAAGREMYRKIGARARIGVPLVKDGRLLTVVAVHSDPPRDWTSAEVRLVEDVAERTWEAVERARAETALRAAMEQQGFLLDLSDALRPLADPVEIQRIATRVLGKHLGASRVFYVSIERDGDTGVIQGDYVDGVPSRVGTYSLSSFAAWTVEAWRAGKLASSSDVNTDARYGAAERAAYASVSTRAGFGVPLVKDGRLAAVLGVNQSTPRAWTDQEMELASEVAERTWAAVERANAEAAVRESERLRTAMLDVLPLGLALVDREGKTVISNREWARFVPSMVIPSRDPDRGSRWRSWHEDGRPVAPADYPGARALRGERVDPPMEFLYDDEGGREIWTSVAAIPVLGTDGEVVGAVDVIQDIDAAKRASEALQDSERHAQILLAELQHRVRNTLAVVRSIARRTAENSGSVDDMLGHFQGRLDAFSRVQAALTRNPQGLVSFISLIEDELVAHALKEGGQVHIDGPELMLEPKAAERFSLAIHELATNAVKHGALANEQGHIAINWAKERLNGSEELVFNWRESGVQIEDVEPKRRGFGMELLGSSLPYDLGAETSIALRPDGLQFELKMPMPKEPVRPPDPTLDPTRR